VFGPKAMIFAVQVIAVLLAMSLSLAHAFELPGKKRLDERA
jgi:hypothetical protein